MSARGAPDIERQVVRFYALSLCRKAAAHFLTPFAHLPESGAFLRKVCTACFPLHKNGTCRGEAPPSCWSKTVRSLKSPTGAFIAPLRCANANLSGRGPSICYRRPFCRLKAPLGLSLLRSAAQTRTCRGEAPPSAIADRSVTQTPHWGVCCFANAKALGEQGSRQFSAFVCVHQPDGFKDLLTRDFCCRWLFVLPGLRCCRGQVLRGHRRVSHADGHAVFEAQRAKRQQKSRHKTDQPCPRFFWKVMLVGYVNG